MAGIERTRVAAVAPLAVVLAAAPLSEEKLEHDLFMTDNYPSAKKMWSVHVNGGWQPARGERQIINWLRQGHIDPQTLIYRLHWPAPVPLSEVPEPSALMAKDERAEKLNSKGDTLRRLGLRAARRARDPYRNCPKRRSADDRAIGDPRRARCICDCRTLCARRSTNRRILGLTSVAPSVHLDELGSGAGLRRRDRVVPAFRSSC